MRSACLLVTAAVALPWTARADEPQPAVSEPPVVVAAEDVSTHARVSRTAIRWSQTFTSAASWGRGASPPTWWTDFGVGPFRQQIPYRGASLGALAHWSWRVRLGVIIDDARVHVAPVTVGARWYRVLDVFDKAPLLHVQTGVEVAVATPWASEPSWVPEQALARLHGVDAEVSGNGWSIRPTDWHVRTDLLICRSAHVELGLGPELFRSTSDDDRPLDYGLRWHATAGIGLGCRHQRNRTINDVTVAASYRARAILYNASAATPYRDSVAIAIQYAPYRATAVGAFVAADPGAGIDDDLLVGLRFQTTWGGPR